eukprot:NODE_80_length_22759_cov_1.466858.p3 type:complete len:858 gc:universal NODE_80_length_22759_cov_1.466858:18949-16376(-)
MSDTPKKVFDVRKILNVQHFEKLTKIFKAYRNEDGSEGFPLEKFKEVFGQVLEGQLNDDQLTSLFMKIDANSDGTVVFEEFSSFILASSSQKQDHEGHLEILIERSKLTSQIVYLKQYSKNLIGIMAFDGNFIIYDSVNYSIKSNVHLPKELPSSWVTSASIPDPNYVIYITDGRSLHIANLNATKLTHLCHVSDFPTSPTSLTSYIEEDTFVIYVGTCIGRIWKFQTKLSKFSNILKEQGFYKNSFASIESKKESVFHITLEYSGSAWIHTIDYLPTIKRLIVLDLVPTSPYTAQLLSTESNVETVQLNLQHNALCMDFSALFNVLGIACRDNNIYLFNTFIWKNSIACLSGHKAEIVLFKIHPSAPYCYSLSADYEFRIWSLYDGQTIQYIQYDNLDFSSNQLRNSAIFCQGNFLIGGRDLRLFNTSQNGISQDSTHKGFCSVKYNPNFHQVVSCSEDVRVFDFDTGHEIFKFCDVHSEEVRHFIFDISGRRLITASTDGLVKIWNFNNGQLLKTCTLPGTFEVMNLYYFSTEPHYVACTGKTGNLFIFPDDPDEEETDQFEQIKFAPNEEISFSFMLDNFVYIATHSQCMYIIDIREKSVKPVKFKKSSPISTGILSFYNGISNIVTAHADGSICLFKINMELIEDSKVNLRKREFITHITDSYHILILCTSLGRGFKVEKSNMTVLKCYKLHNSAITSICNHNGFYITACLEGKVKLWTTEMELIGMFGKNIWDLSNVITVPNDIGQENNNSNIDLESWKNLMININSDSDVLKEYRKNRLSRKYAKKWKLFVYRRRLISQVKIHQELLDYQINPLFEVQISSKPIVKIPEVKRNRIYQHMNIFELQEINTKL